MSGGTTAPPAMPVVMRPDISFSAPGLAESARENITEYIEEIEYPTSPIPAAAEISESAAAVAARENNPAAPYAVGAHRADFVRLFGQFERLPKNIRKRFYSCFKYAHKNPFI